MTGVRGKHPHAGGVPPLAELDRPGGGCTLADATYVPPPVEEMHGCTVRVGRVHPFAVAPSLRLCVWA